MFLFGCSVGSAYTQKETDGKAVETDIDKQYARSSSSPGFPTTE